MNLKDTFDSKQVLITGGLGFIGSNLARRLVELGAHVTLVDSLIPEYGGNLFNINDIKHLVTVNICDVRDPYAMAYLVRGKSYLFNLAGQTSHLDSMTDPKTDMDINIGAQLSILEACRKHNPEIKITFAGTRQIYGKPEYLPADEKHRIQPTDINGINKLAGEMYHTLYNNIYGIRSCVLRLTNVYGPGMRVKDARQTFLGIWIRNVIESKPFLIYGDGTQLRDLNYIDDCVKALLLAAANDASDGRVYNLGGNEVVSLRELADELIGLDVNASYELIPFPNDRKAIDIGDYHGDYSLIKNELGWSPVISLKEGLASTVSYYRRNHMHYWDSSND